MLYSEKYFYLCHVPLSAEGPQDVEIIQKVEGTETFPALFAEYERLRAHATNKDGLYSVIRADKLHVILRSHSDNDAKEKAFTESRANLITNLQHRVMQSKDENAQSILRNVYNIETEIK